MMEMVLFKTGNVLLALDRTCIRHIGSMSVDLGMTKDRRQQQTIDHKGETLSVIDFAASLTCQSPTPPSSDAKVIVLKGSPTLALWADSVKGKMSVNAAQLALLPPVFTGTARVCFPKVLIFKEQLVLVVDAPALASVAQFAPPSPSTHPLEQKPEAETLGATLTVSEVSSTDRSGGHTLEHAVAQNLQRITDRLRKKVEARTLAQTPDGHMEGTNDDGKYRNQKQPTNQSPCVDFFSTDA
jgi:chemotaxis signal transduction protein